jgi:hypothetical protein
MVFDSLAKTVLGAHQALLSCKVEDVLGPVRLIGVGSRRDCSLVPVGVVEIIKHPDHIPSSQIV